MPNVKFLEEYPLYRKFEFEIGKNSFLFPITIDDFPNVNLDMYCPKCNNIRTFRFNYKYIHKKEQKLFIDNIEAHFNIKLKTFRAKQHSPPILEENDIINLNYICAYCEDYYRFFAIKMGEGLETIEKVGQFPAWSRKMEKSLKKLLSKHTDYYKKGKTCEFHSYGIGAFAYYRRIVEDIIGDLLDLIPEILTGEELEKYNEALKLVRKTKNIRDKIAIVKDLLPPILKTEQFNPLKTIYDALSKGIHEKTDDECLDDAESIRTSLVFLVDSILSRKKGEQKYTESMKKILEKQRKKIKRNENKGSSDDKLTK